MMIRRCLTSLCPVIVLALGLSLCGCDKKRSEAIVISKEHIDVAEAKPSPTPRATGDEMNDSKTKDEPVYREMAADEIDVDGFVMNKEVRGTSKDPRAKSEEQWRIRVQIPDARQSLIIQSDRAHYDRLKIGDRIRIKYRQGQFTGKVWFAEIED
jgi:hypothetical protein